MQQELPFEIISYSEHYTKYKHNTITGICNKFDKNVFFKASKYHYDKEKLHNEYLVMSKLQDYDFVPKVIGQEEYNKYYIIYTEIIDAVSLDLLETNDSKFKIGLINVCQLLKKLFIEKGFNHNDMHTNNIMIDINNEVYIIDFEYSKLNSESWTKDFNCFLNSFDHIDFYDLINELSEDSSNIKLLDLYIEKFISRI